MTKACLIVSVFCVCLIALFVVLVYLISNIDPEMSAKYDDAEYFLNINDDLLNQKIGYGLEKVTSEYEYYDETINNITRFKKVYKNTSKLDSVPNESKQNDTKEQTSKYKMVTKPINVVKDLRRSINEEKQHDSIKDMPRSLLLEIKGLAGQAGIEIKLIADKLKGKTNRKHRSSDGDVNTVPKINYVELDSDNTIREASIVIAENGTFILNIFANSIDVIKESDVVCKELESNNRKEGLDNYIFQEITTLNANISEEKTKTFMVNSSISSEIENVNINIDNNLSSAGNTILNNTFEGDENNNNNNQKHLLWEETTVKSTLPVLNQYTNLLETSLKTDLEEVILTTGNFRIEFNETNNASLVGLLISEATAKLPIGD